MRYLMGIDIGTTSLKTMIIDEHGSFISKSTEEYMFDIPVAGYAEQDPAVWWNALIKTVGDALSKSVIQAEEIIGIGLSGQMHGMVPLDRDMNVIRKSILHCDVRSTGQCRQIERIFTENAIDKMVCNPVFPGMLLVSLAWMKEEEPENFEKTAHVVCPKDYIRHLLTGELGTERTDASGTIAYDLKREEWVEQLFGKLGISPSLFPDPNHVPYEIAGHITKTAALLTGLKEGTLVVYGGGDQAMQSVGNGLISSGSMMATIGTSGQVMAITHDPKYNPRLNTHTFCHASPNMWFGLGAILNAGVTLNWFRRNFTPRMSFEKLSRIAGDIQPGSEGLLFFPAMMGERTPYLDARTRGIFFGASFRHTAAHFARAIMEGVSYEMKTSINILASLYPEPEYIVAAGGASRSGVWLQMQADIYAKPLCVKQIDEQACLGAAIMAGVGCGIYEDIRDGCKKAINAEPVFIHPIRKNVDIYRNYYEKVFIKLYDSNVGLFSELP